MATRLHTSTLAIQLPWTLAAKCLGFSIVPCPLVLHTRQSNAVLACLLFLVAIDVVALNHQQPRLTCSETIQHTTRASCISQPRIYPHCSLKNNGQKTLFISKLEGNATAKSRGWNCFARAITNVQSFKRKS